MDAARFIGRSGIHSYNLGIVGLGNVGSALVRLLRRKREELAERYGIGWHITAVASRRAGWLVNHNGLDPERILAGDYSGARAVGHCASWMHAAKPDVVFEASSLNADTGEPAITHIRTALEYNAHAVSANKAFSAASPTMPTIKAQWTAERCLLHATMTAKTQQTSAAAKPRMCESLIVYLSD